MARSTFAYLSDKVNPLQTRLDSIRNKLYQLGSWSEQATEQRLKIKLKKAEGDVETVKDALTKVKLWLMSFYNKGQAKSGWNKGVADPPADKLQSISERKSPDKESDFIFQKKSP